LFPAPEVVEQPAGAAGSPAVNATVRFREVQGDAVGVKLAEAVSGVLNARVDVDFVGGGARVVGVDIGRLGGAMSVDAPGETRDFDDPRHDG
jgi:hypothetical protein